MTLYPIPMQNDLQTSFQSATFDTRPNRTGIKAEEVTTCLTLLRELRCSCVSIIPLVLSMHLPYTLQGHRKRWTRIETAI